MTDDNYINGGKTLAEYDGEHRVYICEYNIVHLKWDKKELVFCPGDFIGLPLLLSGISRDCNLQCTIGEVCPADHGDGIVHLEYNSIQIPFRREECRELHLLVKEAASNLMEMKATLGQDQDINAAWFNGNKTHRKIRHQEHS